MLRVGRKFGQMHAPDRQHDARHWPVQRRDSARDVGHLDPPVAALRDPRCPRQRNQWHARRVTGRDRIPAHLCGKGMGCVDHVADALGQQIVNQPGDAAKAPDTLRQGLTLGPLHTPRKADGAAQTLRGHRIGQLRGLGRTREDQKVGWHG